jgi:hypothetical protein
VIPRCSICKLPAAQLAAINTALQSDISLHEVAQTSGLSKSSLHRHLKHAISGPAISPEPLPPATTEDAQAEIVAPPSAANVSRTIATKEELLGRVEHLWSEALDGLEASKNPSWLNRPDGSRVEIPGGDLRARTGFLRVAADVLRLHCDTSGHFLKGVPLSRGLNMNVSADQIQMILRQQISVLPADARERLLAEPEIRAELEQD